MVSLKKKSVQKAVLVGANPYKWEHCISAFMGAMKWLEDCAECTRKPGDYFE